MKKFTRLWQLTMILLLSSSVMFAQERLEKGISASLTNTSDQVLEKYSDDQIKALENAGYLDGKVMDESGMKGHLEKSAISNPQKTAKDNEAVAKNGGQPTDDLFCPAGAVYGLPANGFTSAGTSDAGPGYLAAQQVFGAYDVDSIHWWGIAQYHNGTAWEDCGENPKNFEIIFYDNAGGKPGTVLGTYTPTIIGDSSGSFFNTAEILEFTFVVPDAITLNEGWVSIQEIAGTDPNCWFLWVNSGTAGPSGAQFNLDWEAVGYPYSLCIYGDFALTNDLVATAITAPNSGFLTAAETVTMEIFNNGSVTQTNFPVSYSLDGATAVNDTFDGSLAPGETGSHSFLATIDCSATGTLFSVECCVNLVGDVNTANDCLTHEFASFAAFDCDWYIVGTDDYGDGWSGGQVDIVMDDITTLSFTIPTGFGPDTTYFGIWEGSTMDVVYTPGSWAYENAYKIYNNFDVEVFTDGDGGVEPSGTTDIPATCIAPACPNPTITNTGLITETTARGFWAKGDVETLWNLEYGPMGFTPGTGTVLTGLTNPNPFGDPYYDFSGLTHTTYYDWYVIADCVSDISDTIGPETFRTSVPTVAIPVLEDFETPVKGFNITGNEILNTVDWVVLDTSLAYGGLSCAYNAPAINSNNTMNLLVKVDLSAKINAQLTFAHVAKTEGGWDHCFVEISTDGGATFTQIPAGNYLGTGVYAPAAFNNDPPNDGPCFDENSYLEWGTLDTPIVDSMWMEEKFNLTPYNIYDAVTVRFRLTTDGSVTYAGWMIDDIAITELACPPVTGVVLDALAPTSATISWSSLAGSSNIEWDTTGFTQGTGNVLTGVTSPQTFGSLMANTTYDVYVQDDCGGSVSDWFLFQFTTTCVECPVGSIAEGEACGDSTNNGCQLVAPLFGAVASGQTICGNMWDDGANIDYDYFSFTVVDQFTRITIIAEGDNEFIIGNVQQNIPGDPGCLNATGSIAPYMIVPPCDEDTLVFDLDAPGTYYIFVRQYYLENNVCPGSKYWFSFNAQALSAPAATYDPDSFAVAVPVDGAAARDLNIGNTGEYVLTYSAAVTNWGLGSKGVSKDVIGTEDFDSGTWPPVGWTVVNNGGTCDWNANTLNAQIANLTPGSGDCAEANSDLCGSGSTMDTELISAPYNLTGYSFASVTFATNYNHLGTVGEMGIVEASNDSGTTWETVGTFTADFVGVASLPLDNFAGDAAVIIRWHYLAPSWDWYWQVDDVVVEGLNAPTGWLTLNGGPVAAGDVFEGDLDDVITVGFDATGLAIGTYTADIELTTNEPATDIIHILPVTFDVKESFTVSGTLTYANGVATVMDMVDVSLLEGTQVVGTTTTDEFGVFSFVTIDGTYAYEATTDKPRGGTDVFDINLVIDHSLGTIPLVGLQFDVSDVTNDGTVDVFDLNGFLDESLGANPVWPIADYLFTDPAVIVAGANTIQDFQSLCSGDPDGSFIPPYFCPLPADLAVASVTGAGGEITWTSVAGNSNIEYGPTGYLLGAGTLMENVTSPTVVPGAAFDVIDVYVQDDCGGLSVSGWIGPVTFTVPGPGSTCETAVPITAVPFTQAGLTTCGFGDDYSSLDVCGSSYMNGDDFVYVYTPGADITVDIALTNTDTWVGVFVTEGCPDAAGTCVATGTDLAGNPSIDGVDLTAAVTYYIIISTYPTPQCTPFDISITEYVPPSALVPPYLQGFDVFVPDGWTEADDGDYLTGPLSPGAGSWSADTWLNVTAGSPCTKVNLYSNFKKDWLISPEFDLSAGGYTVSFDAAVVDWGTQNASAMGSDDEVQFLVSYDSGATWVILHTYNDDNKPSETGTPISFVLTSTDASVFFAFWGSDGVVADAEDYDFMVDNFDIQ